MSDTLLTVEQAAERLKLHPKTVLRYIRNGDLPATRIGKGYRIERGRLDAFAGVTHGHAAPVRDARATCVVEVPSVSADEAERLAALVNAAAMTGDARTPQLTVTTAFDPHAEHLKIVVFGTPSDAARLLEMVDLRLGGRR